MSVNSTSSSTLTRYVSGAAENMRLYKVHHVLGEIIQGGLVLETNINEISTCGEFDTHCKYKN